MEKMPPPIRHADNVKRRGVNGPELVAKTAAPTTMAQTRKERSVGKTR